MIDKMASTCNELRSIAVQTEDMGCSNGCTSIYISAFSDTKTELKVIASLENTSKDLDRKSLQRNAVQEEGTERRNSAKSNLSGSAVFWRKVIRKRKQKTLKEKIENGSRYENSRENKDGIRIRRRKKQVTNKTTRKIKKRCKTKNINEEKNETVTIDDEQHILENFEERRKSEEECYKNISEFTQKNEINITAYVKGRPTTYDCPHCEMKFRWKTQLLCHLRDYTGEKKFLCKHCDKEFISRRDYARHVRTHTREKLFKCSECSREFARSHHLVNHLRRHTGEKPFQCSVCDKTYSRKDALKTHYKITHTGEKPYKCYICEKAFAYSYSCRKHLQTHTGEKPYKCSHCEKSFVWKKSFDTHLRRHAG